MITRLKRHRSFELKLDIKDEDFARTARESQRNWLLNRLMKETSDELLHLHSVASSFITGVDDPSRQSLDLNEDDLGDTDIMEDWLIPVVEKMAGIAASAGGDVLEVGFGRGVSADFIQQYNPVSHTAIECNSAICKRFEQWASKYPGRKLRLVEGMWQDTLNQLDTYDGILFHTYPLDEQEFVEHVVNSNTFAEHFFDSASKLLKPGGKLTYFTGETNSISRAHQRSLFKHFNSFKLSMMHDLDIPDNSGDALWQSQLVIVEATR